MAPFLVHSAPSDDMQCWQTLEMPGEYQTWETCDETAAYQSVNAITDFCSTWHEAAQVTTPYKPRGKPWEMEGVESLTPAEKTCSYASLGSINHANGGCKPCAWFWKAVGCSKGKDCIYCHSCLEGELKNRRKAKMAAFRSGHMPAQASEALGDTDAEAEKQEEQAEPEARSNSDLSLAPAILPIQLESLLPEAASASSMRVTGHVSGDFVPMAQKVASAEASAPCIFPSLPRSAPPRGPPVLQNFDVTPPPPPLQDPLSSDHWQWEQDSGLPWVDSASWLGYPQDHFCMGLEYDAWEGIPDSASIAQYIPADLRSSPPEVVADGKSLWRLPSSPSSSPHHAEACVLIDTRRGMINAFEVGQNWNPCSAVSRSKSCPAEFHRVSGGFISQALRRASEPIEMSPERGRAATASPKSFSEISTPSRRQVRVRGSQPERMVWRRKSTEVPASQDKEASSALAPAHRGGRPRVGRVGPRGPSKAVA